MAFAPTYASVSTHPLPAWFHDAKLGIFIHWGLYSVPAWAPNSGELSEVHATGNWQDWFRLNSYAEWYANTYRIPGSPTQRHHFDVYGHGFAYADFAPAFNQALEEWDPDRWAAFFRQVGARYVVLTAKHHDGFLLWPSRHPNPFHEGYGCRRNVVGELGQAVRAQGLTMAYYYSGGVDWTFNAQVVRSVPDLRRATPQSPAYVQYANAHWRELIDDYETAILWNDIAYPRHTDTNALFAYYYNRMPDGVVNDRFGQRFDATGRTRTRPVHHDFATPEYQRYDDIQTRKWESCRGIGASFGYNQQEGCAQYLSAQALIRSFADIVSKNGNLLLNVGPTAQGRIPSMQAERLSGLGRWLEGNGDAIFATRPWTQAEGATDSGAEIRYTTKGDALYAILLGDVPQEFAIPGLIGTGATQAHWLAERAELTVRKGKEGLAFRAPRPLTGSAAHAIRIAPMPVTPS